MAGFFNPNTAFDPNNPQDFDYQSQAQKLAMLQALAQRTGQPPDQGRMVGGWYAGPSKGATIASALQQALSGVLQVKGMQGQQELDKSDRAAMNAARKAYQEAGDPNKFLEQAQAAHPIPVARQAPTPDTPIVDNGPMDPTMPMQTVSVVGKREGTPPPNPEQIEAAKQGQVKFLQNAMAQQRQDALDRLGRTKSGGPLAQAIMNRDFAPTEYKNFDVKNADGSTDVMAMDPRTGKVLKLAAGTGGMSPYQQAQLEQSRNEAEARRQREDREYGLASGRDSRDAAREAREAGTAETKARNDAVDRKKGLDVLVGGLDHTIRQIDELMPIVGDATGVLGKTMNALSEKTGISTDAKVARSRIESLKGSLLAQAMSMQKQTAGTASGMSEKESLAAQAAIAAIDPNSGEAELKKQLSEARRFMRMQKDRIDASRGLDAPTPTAAAAGNYKVPARGQRVTSPEDYGF